MDRLLIEKVDNGYIVKITRPDDKRASVVTAENKSNVIELVKGYLEDKA